MRALADAIRVAVGDEAALEQRLDHVAHGVVHDPIAERRRADSAALRLAHHWHSLTAGQYEHVSRMVAEIGRLLGGWLRREQRGKGGTGP